MADTTATAPELLKDVTLRDFAALEFMKAIVTNQGVMNADSDAKRAYSLADALIAERENRRELEAQFHSLVE